MPQGSKGSSEAVAARSLVVVLLLGRTVGCAQMDAAAFQLGPPASCGTAAAHRGTRSTVGQLFPALAPPASSHPVRQLLALVSQQLHVGHNLGIGDGLPIGQPVRVHHTFALRREGKAVAYSNYCS